MQNFDTDGNRAARLTQEFKFALGGEDFELRHGLKIGSTILDGWHPVLERMMTDEAGRGDGYEPVSDEEFVAIWRATMIGLLLPGQEAAVDRVLANETEPVTIPDLVDVILWAVRTVAGGRPTEALSASSNGSTTPNTEPGDSSSREESSSPADAPSTN